MPKRVVQRRQASRSDSGTSVDHLADPLSASDVATRGTRGGGGPLPYKDRIQSSFGHHDIGGVSAHTDEAAWSASQSLGARAFAFGDRVGFNSSSPGLHTAAHEAAHVVQQRGGVQLKDDMGQAGDRYERHADAVADVVVAGGDAAPLLDQMTGSQSSGGAAVQARAVQLDEDTLSTDVDQSGLSAQNSGAEDFVKRTLIVLRGFVARCKDSPALIELLAGDFLAIGQMCDALEKYVKRAGYAAIGYNIIKFCIQILNGETGAAFTTGLNGLCHFILGKHPIGLMFDMIVTSFCGPGWPADTVNNVLNFVNNKPSSPEDWNKELRGDMSEDEFIWAIDQDISNKIAFGTPIQLCKAFEEAEQRLGINYLIDHMHGKHQKDLKYEAVPFSRFREIRLPVSNPTDEQREALETLDKWLLHLGYSLPADNNTEWGEFPPDIILRE